MASFSINGQIVDILQKKIYPGEIQVADGRIASIKQVHETSDQYILPGFIDAHVHIESSMLAPSEFARIATTHGTVATISDPHEIGNVMGASGLQYMIDNGDKVNFKFHFGVPSCVPATPFETAGAAITASEISELLKNPKILYLSEMMNWPGVLNNDKEVYEKIKAAQALNKPIDGHAPGLKGDQARKYAQAGISTDHECFSREEAEDKIRYGMMIAIREGSAAKNFEALYPLIDKYPDKIMLCSDDKHPDDLVKGHINLLVKRAIDKGTDLFNVLRAACINPISHYKLNVGQLREGDPADFILMNDLKDFMVQKTFIDGEIVAQNGQTAIPAKEIKIVNNFNIQKIRTSDLEMAHPGVKARVIVAEDHQLVTGEELVQAKESDGSLVSDTHNDILKLVVVNRYEQKPPSIGLVKNFGMRSGAIASSVAHDSHNIVAVGVSDEELCFAINMVIESKGGVAAVNKDKKKILPLPVAGLMSEKKGYQVAEAYEDIDRMVKEMGSPLTSPFMTLSFMSLLVIPRLKLSDKGLFDGESFNFVSLFHENLS